MDDAGDPTPFSRKLVGLMKQAIATDGGEDQVAMAHRLLIKPPGHDHAIAYTVYLQPDEKGTFLVTCKELPDILMFGETEEAALLMAEYAIVQALSPRQKSSDS